jgi:isoleucyl-tRNA synthetase
VDDLSNWYVRLSRRRFWKSESDSDKLAAYSTLYEVLVALVKLMAPVMPFTAETMYQNLVRSTEWGKDQPESVHHCDFPVADESLIDRQLLADTSLTQKVVSLGRSARNKFNMKVRQPLRAITVRPAARADEEALRRVESQILSELNVKSMNVTSDVGDLIHYVIKPNLPVLGPKYGKRLGAIRTALQNAEPAAVARQVENEEPLLLSLGVDNNIEILPNELLVETQEKEGFAVAQDGGLVVALDTELDEELIQEGLARELVRTINDMRKAAGFDISDRIVTYYNVPADGADSAQVQGALANYGDYIRAETLSTRLVEGAGPENAYSQTEKVGPSDVTLAVEKTPAE